MESPSCDLITDQSQKILDLLQSITLELWKESLYTPQDFLISIFDSWLLSLQRQFNERMLNIRTGTTILSHPPLSSMYSLITIQCVSLELRILGILFLRNFSPSWIFLTAWMAPWRFFWGSFGKKQFFLAQNLFFPFFAAPDTFYFG